MEIDHKESHITIDRNLAFQIIPRRHQGKIPDRTRRSDHCYHWAMLFPFRKTTDKVVTPHRMHTVHSGATGKLAATLSAFFVFSAASWGAHVEIVVRDDTGADVHLVRPARRIVTLAPHLTETVFAAGAGDKLVGVVQFSDYPEAAKKIPSVGGYTRLDLEAVIALKPDLIIAWQSGNMAGQIDKLSALGYPVYRSQPDRVEDIATEIEHIGLLAGTSDTATAAAIRFRQKMSALQKRYSSRPSVRVFYQVSQQPLMTIGGKQFISSVIRTCGGVNIFEALNAMAPSVSVEAVVAANPEAIVASGMGDGRPEWLNEWLQWPRVTAVARRNLFYVSPALLQRPTPRLLDGTELLCQNLETARSHRL